MSHKKAQNSQNFCAFRAFLWLLLRRGLLQLRVERGSLPIVTARSALRVLAIHGITKGELHIRLKFLVIVVSDDLANALRAARKLQRIDGPRIGGKPVETIDLFPIRFKPREQIFRSFSSNIRDRLPIRLHNLKILVIDPDLTLEIPLILLDRLRPDIENITVDLIDHFFAQIFQVVLPNVVACQNEPLNFSNILQILGRELNTLK